jgi:hypothetical protein
MEETKEQRIQRLLDSAIERSRREEEIKGGIASMWESMNPGQKPGMAPIPVVSDIAGENLYVEEGTGRIGAFDRMWPNIPRSHRGDDMTWQFLEEMGYKEVFDVSEKAPNTFIRDGDKFVTYTPSFNKSGIEQKTFKDPTFGELGDFFGGFSKGGTVTKPHGGMVDKAIAGGSKDI